jgi:hypothetical protein
LSLERFFRVSHVGLDTGLTPVGDMGYTIYKRGIFREKEQTAPADERTEDRIVFVL